jgi:Holliday junction resolvasome RuvABC endonuclease subunit
VQAYFGLAEPPEPPDVADAIAIAMCASQRHGAVV